MQQLPDLMPWMPANNSSAFDWTIRGDELRITSAIANVGEGDLEIRGGATHNGVQDVYQRIYNDDGTYNDVQAGEFVHHAGHGHIHFEDFAEFRLREVNSDGSAGDIIATGDKVSFCLIDVTAHGLTPTGSRDHLSCGQVQGISAGWADVYSQGLPGQMINIANVPNGDYFLEIVADPSNLLVESDETNNVTRTQITIDRVGGPDPVTGDLFEENESFDTASVLAPPEDHIYEDLSIHRVGDDDFFRVTASGTGTMTISVNHRYAQGDLDMRVFDADQNRIGFSNTTSNNESVSFEAVEGTDYFVQVYGYLGQTNDNYDLVVDQPENDHSHGSTHVDVAGQTQYLTGSETETDIFVINGNSTDYGWGPTEDNQGVVVWSATSHDLLYNFEHIRFNDREVALTNDGGHSNDDGVNDIADVTQYLTGEGLHDTFNINGPSSDYQWSATQDGQGIVVWNTTTNAHDILYSFEHIQFSDVKIDLVPHDDPNVTQYLTGSASQTDRFIIRGDSTDYGWGDTEDGQGTVVWNNTNGAHDLLYDFEEIAFNDQVVSINDQVA